MIAVAGAEAISICGGPTIPVTLGRLDSLDPDSPGRLPQESLDASALKQCFQMKGISTQELVALRCLERIIRLVIKALAIQMFSTIPTTRFFSRSHGRLQLECRA
ncbi:putative L-ascorbate peroxidase 6 [Punica granatum]|uniref:L-ascorbate peroxidase 6 n=1 Tax=Punica granatum TaxID=22663 RepID=A0A6P8BTU7_PUNGR|nr:putative L-ascorbate peroxidase 6 [Punica granatum]XP_031374307.1 putative L-ascorbate peroxidase 6 [Punica granatum]